MELENAVTLYLEGWQKRMLKDFSDLKDIERISKIKFKPGGGCLASYKIPPKLGKDDWLMYLTDSQIVQLHEQLKLHTTVTSVNVTAKALESGAISFG